MAPESLFDVFYLGCPDNTSNASQHHVAKPRRSDTHAERRPSTENA